MELHGREAAMRAACDPRGKAYLAKYFGTRSFIGLTAVAARRVVATWAFIKAGDFRDTRRLATRLRDDPHHLVRRAVDWMLREVARRSQPRP